MHFEHCHTYSLTVRSKIVGVSSKVNGIWSVCEAMLQRDHSQHCMRSEYFSNCLLLWYPVLASSHCRYLQSVFIVLEYTGTNLTGHRFDLTVIPVTWNHRAGWLSEDVLESYSCGPQFESVTGNQRSWLRFLPIPLSHSRQMPRDIISIRAWPFFSKSFPVHQSSYHSTLYSLNTDNMIKKSTEITISSPVSFY